jgi:hypothetical protein
VTPVRVNPHAKTIAQLAQQFQKVEMLGVIAEDVLAFVATGGDVISLAGPFDANGEMTQMPCPLKPGLINYQLMVGPSSNARLVCDHRSRQTR